MGATCDFRILYFSDDFFVQFLSLFACVLVGIALGRIHEVSTCVFLLIQLIALLIVIVIGDAFWLLHLARGTRFWLIGPRYECCAQPLSLDLSHARHWGRILLPLSPRIIVQSKRSFFCWARKSVLQMMRALSAARRRRSTLGGRQNVHAARFLIFASAPGLYSAPRRLLKLLRTLSCAMRALGERTISMLRVLHSKVALQVQCKCDRPTAKNTVG